MIYTTELSVLFSASSDKEAKEIAKAIGQLINNYPKADCWATNLGTWQQGKLWCKPKKI